MRKYLPLLLSASVVLSACKAKEMLDQAKIAEDLKDKGTIDLMKEVSEDQYEAPADGRLTDAQIQMYLKVRDKEKVIAQVAKKELEQHSKKSEQSGEKSLAGALEGLKGLGSVADFLTADIRAAKDLGFNTQEYLWVKTQVLAASGLEMQEKSQQAINQMMEQSYQSLKKQHDEATDEATKSALAEMVAAADQSRKDSAANQADVDPAAAYNRELLKKYENALNALVQEASKFEDNPGDAQKSIDEMQKSLDNAAAASDNNG